MVKLLIEKGANVNALDSDRNTPLHIAAQGKTDDHHEAAELLIAAGADVNAFNGDQETPLDGAEDPRSNLIKLILQIQ